MYKQEVISRYIFTIHHLKSIRLYFILTDSSEARKQYDEYCLSIMQTITYAHDIAYFQGTGWIVSFDLRECN
jgi:hypothetical protein